MASTIKLKRGSGAPTSGTLAAGEPALDLTNNKLYTSTDGTDIVEVSSYSLPTEPSFTSVNVGVYSLTGTDIDPANGALQYKTLSANTTFTEALSSGDSVVVRLSGGDTYTVTWPTITWVTAVGNIAPTLSGNDVVVLWKENTTLYGAYVGYF
jgi:hypothetical protein